MVKNKISRSAWPYLLLLLGGMAWASCKSAYNPVDPFQASQTPPPPNYAEAKAWAALPLRADEADRTPSPDIKDLQATALVDVFFLHPTTLTESRKEWKVWNGDLNDQRLNQKTDDVPILYQASAFNGAGRVYAPRYRQAHYHSFFTKDTHSAQQAEAVAYEDVKAAFLYYLEHYNEGRPFILAAHSQGALHGMRLLKEVIEPRGLKDQLVVAYLLGWAVPLNYFKSIPPCNTPEETGCFCSWRTFERKYGLKYAKQTEIACTNPLIWKTGDSNYAPRSLHKGAVLKDFKKVFPQLCDAESYKGLLLCTKPKFPGSFLLRTKNYHPGDLNLYYMNVRENAMLRAYHFTKR